jgi:NAD(P)-dependent dehydrogenase (short-subunit alcohol dehydrogenase family)
MSRSIKELYDLTDKVAVITGGAGLLGRMHAEAIAENGGIPVIADLNDVMGERVAKNILQTLKEESIFIKTDITKIESVAMMVRKLKKRYGRIDVLINNAANNPKMENKKEGQMEWSRFENFPLELWDKDIQVGLTGAFICCQIIGAEMASAGKGVILNILSDLAVIAPDQRLYRTPGVLEELQPVKPVTYSVVKGALLMLTKYLSTYWADQNVRVNALSPGGVYNGQSDDFVQRLSRLIPLGRMAQADEYKGAVAFLVSDASSYMTGANLIVDGGRTTW